MCILYPPCWLNYCTQLQGGDTPLHLAAWGGHITRVEHLLSTPGIDVNIKDMVSRMLRDIRMIRLEHEKGECSCLRAMSRLYILLPNEVIDMMIRHIDLLLLPPPLY